MAGLLFAAVLALRLGYGEPGDGYSMFFALPVALLAVTFGVRGGFVGALTAVVLMTVWVVHDEVHLGALAWGARVVPTATLGGALAAAGPLLVCMAISVVGWYLTDAGGHGTPSGALRVGALGWLAGKRSIASFRQADFRMSFG